MYARAILAQAAVFVFLTSSESVYMGDSAPVLAFSAQDLAALAAVSCRIWHGAGSLVEETARASGASRVQIFGNVQVVTEQVVTE